MAIKLKTPAHTDNYAIPSRISFWIATISDTGALGTYFELGCVSDIDVNLSEEVFKHESSREGITTVDKVVPIKFAGEVGVTLHELVGENLRLAFKCATVNASATITVYEAVKLNLSGTTATTIWDKAKEDGDYLSLTIRSVTSTDGVTTYTLTTDYLFVDKSGSPGATVAATISRVALGSIVDGQQVRVEFSYERSSNSYSLQDGSILEARVQLQCLSQVGAQFIFIFNKCNITLKDSLAINPSENQKLGMTFEVLTDGSGNRGTCHILDDYETLQIT